MKRTFLIISLIGAVIFQAQSANSERLKKTINSSWQFHKGDVAQGSAKYFEDDSWERINIPHTWNDLDVQDEKKGYYRGIGWYRKWIDINNSNKDKQFFLYFEGANQDVDVFVNGNHVGNHKGGYTAFSYDITEHLNFNEEGITKNLIAIRVDNSHDPNIPPLSADFTFFGGIYRDLFLVSTNKVHFDLLDHASSGVYIETPEVSEEKANVQIRGKLVNDGNSKKKIKVVNTIYNEEGKKVTEFSDKVRINGKGRAEFETESDDIKNPHLWHPDHPYLYKVSTKIVMNNKVIDEVTNPLGFRWYRFDADKGFFINGEQLKLIGANRHQDYERMGNALPDDRHRKDMEKLKKMGANSIRIAHYPQDPAILEACDRLGLIAWEEIPIVNYITTNKQFTKNCKYMLKDMIRQHHNHPSIVMWGYMNEVLLKPPMNTDSDKYKPYREKVRELTQTLDDLAKKEDPQRYTTIAHHGDFERYHKAGLTKIPDLIAWNLYNGWYSKGMEGAGDFLDKFHEECPDKPVYISEYGAGSDPRIHADQPKRFDFSTEWQLKYHQSYVKQIKERPFCYGGGIWNFADFSSEGRKDPVPTINSKGILKIDREPKDIYYWYKAILSEKPFVHIGATDWKNRVGIPAGKNEKFVKQPVKIFTNQDKVNVTFNGKDMGEYKVEYGEAEITLPFVDGKNQLIVKTNGNEEQKSDVLNFNYDVLPYSFKDLKPYEEININVGAHFHYVDKLSKEVWMPGQSYRNGQYGYKNADVFVFKTWSGIRTGHDKPIYETKNEPLYQTLIDSVSSYKIDVPDGEYEVTLLFAEPYTDKKMAKLANNLGAGASKNNDNRAAKRIFNVYLNDRLVLKNLNIAEQYGSHVAVKEKFVVNIKNNNGLNINFEAIKGSAILNGIKIRKRY